MKIFIKKTQKKLIKKLKLIKLSFKINFIKKNLYLKDIYEFNQELINKVKNNNKEIIEKNKMKKI